MGHVDGSPHQPGIKVFWRICLAVSCHRESVADHSMCDCLTMATFDDYPELMAAGSAISLIAGVSSIADSRGHI
jgi:hypothetical protein